MDRVLITRSASKVMVREEGGRRIVDRANINFIEKRMGQISNDTLIVDGDWSKDDDIGSGGYEKLSMASIFEETSVNRVFGM